MSACSQCSFLKHMPMQYFNYTHTIPRLLSRWAHITNVKLLISSFADIMGKIVLDARNSVFRLRQILAILFQICPSNHYTILASNPKISAISISLRHDHSYQYTVKRKSSHNFRKASLNRVNPRTNERVLSEGFCATRASICQKHRISFSKNDRRGCPAYKKDARIKKKKFKAKQPAPSHQSSSREERTKPR